MAALDRKNLVKDGKYNTSEVMKRAWVYFKNPFSTEYRNNFKRALKAAWLDAKMVMAEMKMDNAPRFNRNVSVATLYACSSSRDMRNGTVCW